MKHKICHCGTCESASMRAVAIVGKMMDDRECAQYMVAVGIALAAAGSSILSRQIQGVAEDKGMPEFLAVSLAEAEMTAICNGLSDEVKADCRRGSNVS